MTTNITAGSGVWQVDAPNNVDPNDVTATYDPVSSTLVVTFDMKAQDIQLSNDAHFPHGIEFLTFTAPSAPATQGFGLKTNVIVPPRLLAIGSSTGGPQALFTLVQGLGKTLNVPVVLTQHMPATFTPILAAHIDKLGGMPCAEAKEGEMLTAGRIYLAPGDRHLLIDAARIGLQAHLTSDPPENFCRPSVDPMLRSAATACDGRVLVAMLTGMGQDGLVGTRRVVDGGGCAVAQDEATSVVWGMPGAVAQAGLCHAVLPLPRIAPKLLEMLRMPRI